MNWHVFISSLLLLLVVVCYNRSARLAILQLAAAAVPGPAPGPARWVELAAGLWRNGCPGRRD